MKTKKQYIWNIIFTVVAILIVAGLGSLFVNIGLEWFDNLVKPSQWLPDFVIPIMWSVIYIAFAIILILWQKNENLPKNIFVLLIINGALNVLWCLIFFTLKQLLLGNIIILINSLFAIALIYEISKCKKIYSYVLSVYPIWCCLATTLNLAVWILN